MKLKIYTLTIILFTSFASFAQAPDWAWLKSAGGAFNNEYGYSTTTDAFGNVYAAGNFDGPTITFGSFTLTNAVNNGDLDIFLVKYDPSGNVLWAKSGNGAGDDGVNSITTDAEGNVYMIGVFRSQTITFNSTVLSISDPSHDNFDIFIVKYDPSGNVSWAKSVYGTSDVYGKGLTTDKTGNVIITGIFGGPIKFDNVTLDLGFNEGIFIAKYNSSGNVQWAKSASGSSNSVEGNGITTDTTGNVYVTGFFNSPSIVFGNDTLVNQTTNTSTPCETFIAKYDSSGNVLWAKSAGGDSFGWSNATVTDSAGNVYITGIFTGADITFGNETLTNAGDAPSIFITKYDPYGNVQWAKTVGGSSHSYSAGQDITTDAIGNVYITGSFTNNIIFGNTNLTSGGSVDILVAKYSPAGNILWAKSAGGDNGDFGNSISTDVAGNVYITGHFYSLALIFDRDTLTNSNQDPDLYPPTIDFFIAKLNATTVLPMVWGSFTAEKNSNTTLLKWNTLQEQNTSKYIVERSADGFHFTAIGSVVAAGNSNFTSNYLFNDATPLHGVNFYRLKQVDKDGKFIYSEVRSVNFNNLNNTISISPNPAKNLLRLSIAASERLSTTSTINIYSSAMQLVQTIKVTQADRNTITIPVDRLASGIYFLQLVNAGRVSTVKFAKE